MPRVATDFVDPSAARLCAIAQRQFTQRGLKDAIALIAKQFAVHVSRIDNRRKSFTVDALRLGEELSRTGVMHNDLVMLAERLE